MKRTTTTAKTENTITDRAGVSEFVTVRFRAFHFLFCFLLLLPISFRLRHSIKSFTLFSNLNEGEKRENIKLAG